MATELGPAKISVELNMDLLTKQLDAVESRINKFGKKLKGKRESSEGAQKIVKEIETKKEIAIRKTPERIEDEDTRTTRRQPSFFKRLAVAAAAVTGSALLTEFVLGAAGESVKRSTKGIPGLE